MKKSILLLAMLALCGAVIFAGGGGEAAPAASGAGVSQPVTITFQQMTNLMNDGYTPVFEAIERNLNIRTEVERRAAGSEGEIVVRTRLAAGDMADLFSYNAGSKLNDLNPPENCEDLTSAFASRLDPQFAAAATLNGKVYAVPGNYAAQGGAIWYSKSIYQKLGLQIPKTWQEFLANCEKAQAAGYTGLLGAYRDTWTSQMIFLSEEYYVKKAMPDWPRQYTANKAKFATFPAARRSFEKLAESAKYLNRDYLATSLLVGLEKMANGEAAHFSMQTQFLSTVAGDFPDKLADIGVFAQPGDDPNDQGLTIWMPVGLYVYKNSEKIAAAKQWIDFFLTQEAFLMYSSKVKIGGPPVINGLKLPADAIPGVLDMQKYFDGGKTAPALEYESPVKGPALEQLCIEVVSGRMTPAAAAAAYDSDVQKQAVFLNLPGWN